MDKGEVIHYDGKIRKADCYLIGDKLGKGEVQQDLGLLVHQSMKARKHSRQ